MQMTRKDFLGGLGAAMAAPAFAQAKPALGTARPSASHLRWSDQELGMFYHFDIPLYTPGWNWRSFRNLPDAKLYNPSKLDCDQWMEAAKAYGAKYVVFVAKHCSGFLQWQSDVYPYSCRQATNWKGGKGDVVKEFCDAARRHGLKPGLYASVSANAYLRYDARSIRRDDGPLGPRPEAEKRYARACERMAEELWSRYGELFEIWFDGGAKPPSHGGPNLMPILEKYQPNAVLFQGPKDSKNLIRWVGNERGVAPYPCWSTDGKITQEDGTKEFKFPGSPDGAIWCPGECDVPLKVNSWMSTDRGRYWTPAELMRMYLHSVGRNCNLLLNCAPRPDGSVDPEDMRRYVAFGRAIRARFAHPLGTCAGEGATLELPLAKDAAPVNQVVLAERLQDGERIRAFTVEGLVGNAWKPLYTGSCVGHKHIACFAPAQATRLRLTVTQAAARPILREFTAYHV